MQGKEKTNDIESNAEILDKFHMYDEKKSFKAYYTWRDQIFNFIDDNDLSRLIRAIWDFEIDGVIPNWYTTKPNEDTPVNDASLSAFFGIIKWQLELNRAKYEEIRQKRIESGSKGGQATQDKNKNADEYNSSTIPIPNLYT